MNNRKNELLETFNSRFACKLYDDQKKITDEDFNFILETGRLSPSSFGWEPWKFVVVQNPEVRDKIKEFSAGAGTHLDTSSHFILLLARKSNHTKAGSAYVNHIATNIQHLPEEIVELKDEFYKNFQENDFDLSDDRKLFDWASKQTYIALANMLTSAQYIGIDSCPIEAFNREKVEEILVDEGILNTDDFGLSVMASFGYRSPDVERFPKTRRTIDQVVEYII